MMVWLVRRVLRLIAAVLEFQADEDRALRVYRLHRGKSVYARSSLELIWLEDDYEEMYGVVPIFDFHPHPALADGEFQVTLKTTIRQHW